MEIRIMTCRELLKMEYPAYVSSFYVGGCVGCPCNYNYAPEPSWCNRSRTNSRASMSERCTRCWDRLLAVPFKEDGTIVKELITTLGSMPPEMHEHPVTQMVNHTEMDIPSMYPEVPPLECYSDYLKRQKKLYIYTPPTVIRPNPVYTFSIQGPKMRPEIQVEFAEMVQKDFDRYMRQDIRATAEVASTLRESLAKRKENTMKRRVNEIKKVIFNDPATIVFWRDGSKTVVKAVNEDFDPEKGLAMAIAKKHLGNEGNYYDIFKKWLPKKEEAEEVDGTLAATAESFHKAIEEIRSWVKMDEEK